MVGCAAPGRANVTPPAPTSSEPKPSSATSDARFADLEIAYDARVGVFALDIASGRTLAHRADERFAYCSTFKALAAGAVLSRRTIEALDENILYSADDLVDHSPVTQQHVGTGMTIRALCDAAVRFSDNTAANLLFRDLDGPSGLNGVLAGIGDDVTRMDRIETDLNTAIPGDDRDTTTPAAFAKALAAFAVGDVLPQEKQTILRDWMAGNSTGDELIRAGLPAGWVVEDKSGGGAYGTRNDIGIVWPPSGGPIALSVFSTRGAPEATYDNALIAEAARVALDSLR